MQGVNASPFVLEFVEPMGNDAAANERRWQSMVDDEFDARPGDEQRRLVPPDVQAVLRPVVGTKRKDGTIDHILAVRPLN
jgi:hypothetical protein